MTYIIKGYPVQTKYGKGKRRYIKTTYQYQIRQTFCNGSYPVTNLYNKLSTVEAIAKQRGIEISAIEFY